MVFTITNPHLLLAVYDEIFSLRLSSTRKPIYLGLRVAKRIEKTDIGFLDTNLTSFGSTRKPFYLGLRVAKRIEKTDIGFLDTNLTSFGSTRKPFLSVFE
jgi:hypothetical protein